MFKRWYVNHVGYDIIYHRSIYHFEREKLEIKTHTQQNKIYHPKAVEKQRESLITFFFLLIYYCIKEK